MAKKKEKKVREKKVKEKKEREPISKKKLLIIILALVLILGGAAGAVSFVILSNKSPEVYWDEKEKVASVTKIVGDRKCKTEETDKSVTYTYKKVKDSKADIKKYTDYLIEKREFADIEMPKEIKEETKDTAQVEEQDTQEGTKEQTKEEETKENEKKKTHYELGADSQKEGKLLKVTMDVKKESYVIKIQTKKGTLEEALKEIEEAKKKQEEEKQKAEDPRKFTDALEKVQSLTPEQLGVSVPVDQLTFFPYPGILNVNNKEYYKVTVYTRRDTGVVDYAGSFLADCRSVSELYKYDEYTQSATPIE